MFLYNLVFHVKRRRQLFLLVHLIVNKLLAMIHDRGGKKRAARDFLLNLLESCASGRNGDSASCPFHKCEIIKSGEQRREKLGRKRGKGRKGSRDRLRSGRLSRADESAPGFEVKVSSMMTGPSRLRRWNRGEVFYDKTTRIQFI